MSHAIHFAQAISDILPMTTGAQISRRRSSELPTIYGCQDHLDDLQN
jgi:hypothetical protein